VAGGTSVNTSFITVGNPLVMTLSAQYAAQPGHEVDADLLDVARSVHEEFDTRVEPTVVEDCLREVASRFDGARVRSFVPLLVRRYTRDALNRVVAA
jgi:hypothetical protein